MKRVYSNEYKIKLFNEYEEWLRIVYRIGKGLMLRQQMVILAVDCIGLNKIQAEVALTMLSNAGMIVLSKPFANCKNRIVCYSKVLVALITKSDSKHCWVPKYSTSNVLYHTYKTELAIDYLRRLGKDKFKVYVGESPVLLSKNNGVKLYQLFDGGKTLRKKTLFTLDYNNARGFKMNPVEIGERSNNFNFNKLLTNNFLVSGIRKENEEKILELYYLRVSRLRMHTLYELLKCMLIMFNHYFEDINRVIKTINVTIVFFNEQELNSFKRSWNYKQFKKRVGKEYNYLSDILKISYRSLDLDKKYNLSRDL